MAQGYSFFKSIRAKASLLFFAVFLIIILPVLYIIFSKVKSTLEKADTKELRVEAEKMMSQVTLDPLIIPLPLPGYSLKLQHYRDLYPEEIFTSPDFPVLTGESFLLDTYEFDTLKVVNLTRKAEGPGSLILSLARSNRRLLDQVNDITIYLSVASIASLIFAGILVLMATGLMLKPLQRIINVAERINASNSIERVPVPTSEDESRKLAETLNAMLSRIESTIKNQINFFASATHELKTPLAVMQTELSVSINKTRDSEVKKILESQLMEVQRLDRIIHDFLLMSQLKSDSLSLRKKEEQPEEVIYAAIKQLKHLSEDRSTQIQVMLEGEENQSIDLDFDKMQTVFTNLIENAVKYSPVNSVVRVVINGPRVSIYNTTITPVTNIESLTNEFKKSEELSAGLGMGLWLCDQIINLHHAELTLSFNDPVFLAKVDFSRPLQ
ncbi:hypothetical protein BH09BAC3_BH09BAC3_31220 [soil metagenome]